MYFNRTFNELIDAFKMDKSEKPEPPKGEVVMEGEKPNYDKKNMIEDWNPIVGGFESKQENNIHPTFKKFWTEKGDRIAELVNVGGWNPTGYGDIREDEDEYLYDRIGLTEDEFLEHVYLISKVSGMVDILGNDHLEWFQDQMEIEWERIENQKQNSKEEE